VGEAAGVVEGAEGVRVTGAPTTAGMVVATAWIRGVQLRVGRNDCVFMASRI